MFIYISIGNSDDKLSQSGWHQFCDVIDRSVKMLLATSPMGYVVIHGNWYSKTDDPWQNACWCVEMRKREGYATLLQQFREHLHNAGMRFGQDSIAWAVAETTVFL